jgi:hypothetical protein
VQFQNAYHQKSACGDKLAGVAILKPEHKSPTGEKRPAYSIDVSVFREAFSYRYQVPVQIA